MKINIIAFGSLSKEWKNLYNKYVNKINYYANVTLIELKEVNDKNIDL